MGWKTGRGVERGGDREEQGSEIEGERRRTKRGEERRARPPLPAHPPAHSPRSPLAGASFCLSDMSLAAAFQLLRRSPAEGGGAGGRRGLAPTRSRQIARAQEKA